MSNKTDRAARSVGARPQLALQGQEFGLSIELEGERIEGVALIATTGAILSPEVGKGVEITRTNHVITFTL